MNFNNPEEITTYVKAATDVVMGVDDVVRAFKDQPRRPAFQQYMNKQLGIEEPLNVRSAYEKAVEEAMNPGANQGEEKTPQEKINESMIGEAVQEDTEIVPPVQRLQVVPYTEGGKRYETGMMIEEPNPILSPEAYRRMGFEPTLDERGQIIGLTSRQGDKFRINAGQIIPVGPF